MLLRSLVPPTPKGWLSVSIDAERDSAGSKKQKSPEQPGLVLIYWPAGYLGDLPVMPLTPAWMGITPARARVGIMPVWAMVLVVGKVVSPVWSNSVYLGRRRRTCGPPTASQISASPYNRASRLDDDGRFGNHSHSGRRYFYRWRSLSHRGRCFLGRRWSLCCRGRLGRCIKVGGVSRAQDCADRDDCSRGRNNNTTHVLPPTLIQPTARDFMTTRT